MHVSKFAASVLATLVAGLGSASGGSRPLSSPQVGAATGAAGPMTFYTVAGAAGVNGSTSGTRFVARFHSPESLALDAAGNLYLADSGNSLVRKVTPGGIVSSLPSPYIPGSLGVFFPDFNMDYAYPSGVAVDAAGNIYVADMDNSAIRKITTDGQITIVGGGAYTYYGDPATGSTDGFGNQTRFNFPRGVAVDAAGNVYVADTGNSTIRKISLIGEVTTLAGSAGHIGKEDGTGSAARFWQPYGLAADAAGNLIVADTYNHAIRKVTSAGEVTTVAGLAGTSGSTDGIGSAARFMLPAGVAVGADGTIYVADMGNSTIRQIAPDGTVTTIAGLAGSTGAADGTGSTARFYRPCSVAVDRDGSLYVADMGNSTIRRGWAGPATPVLIGDARVEAPLGQSIVHRPLFLGASGGYSATGLPPGLSLDAVTGTISGTPTSAGTFAATLGATNATGQGTGTLTFTVNPLSGIRGHLANLSVRTRSGSGDDTLILGLVVGGARTGGTKPLLIRGVGPSLTSYGVAGALADPGIEFIRQGTTAPLATNDDWAGDAAVAALANATGAFPLAGAASKDAALALTPQSGNYSVKINGAGTTSGLVLGEVYDGSGFAFTDATPRLMNISARARAGTGDDVLIAGFVISGTTARTVLIRAVGPTLGAYQVSGLLADPTLELTQNVGGETLVLARNDDWAGDPVVAGFSATVGAFALSGPTSKDAAILVTLPPGVYSAKASGAGATTGVTLIEIYEVP